ncbi:hypothetical protein QQF64_031368, partial [Cirrhinus molitorella]
MVFVILPCGPCGTSCPRRPPRAPHPLLNLDSSEIHRWGRVKKKRSHGRCRGNNSHQPDGISVGARGKDRPKVCSELFPNRLQLAVKKTHFNSVFIHVV